MFTHQTVAANRTPSQARELVNKHAVVPAAHVKFLLREIAIKLHSTKAVGWKDGAIAPKKG
jgi:hypothetical protein